MRAPRAQRPPRAAPSEEPRTTGDIEDGFNPWEILRVSRGTSFQGLVNARQLAEEKAAGDEGELGRIARAFEFFVAASRRRFEEMAEASPESADAAFQLGNFHQTCGDGAAAAEWYGRALALDPGHVDSLNQAAGLALSGGDAEAAEALFERADAASPGDVDVLFNWAVAKLSRGDLDGTRGLVNRIVGIRPDLADHPLVKELNSD